MIRRLLVILVLIIAALAGLVFGAHLANEDAKSEVEIDSPLKIGK